MNKISNHTYNKERALYGISDSEVINCKFEGDLSNESPLKEISNVTIKRCYFALCYSIWHGSDIKFDDNILDETSRAPFWYCSNLEIHNSRIDGIKAVRECNSVIISNSTISSDEFGWKCTNIKLKNLTIKSQYIFFDSKNLEIDHLDFDGKYSFQYVYKMTISNSILNTKDAFWHSKNVIVKNCEINGEYLGWYSENLTLINCSIKGTQPFCYCKNLKLINCEMTGCDLAFEYSDVEASIHGKIKSIKNPTSGKIIYEECEEIILSNSNKDLNCIIIKK